MVRFRVESILKCAEVHFGSVLFAAGENMQQDMIILVSHHHWSLVLLSRRLSKLSCLLWKGRLYCNLQL